MTETFVPGSRILALDATRGAAMLFACLAHFAWWLSPPYLHVSDWLSEIGKVATPAFMLLSGAALGLRVASVGLSSRLRLELVDRGIFLVTVAHILIAWSEVHRGGNFLQRLVQLNSVDAIGIACIATAALPREALTDPRVTMRASVGLMGLGWLVALFWHPSSEFHRVVEELSVGDLGARPVIEYACPLVQYLALYAIGTVLGGAMFGANRRNGIQSLGSGLVKFGGVAMVSAAAIHVLVMIVTPHVGASIAALLRRTFSASMKLPPSPGYLAFFGGAALTMTGLICVLSYQQSCRAALSWLAVLGKASLFVFVLQFFVILTLPDLLNIHPNAMSPLLFVAEVALLWICARGWLALRGNRWMIMGLSRTMEV